MEDNGLHPERTLLGIHVNNGVDGWIVETLNASDEDAKVRLHHRNTLKVKEITGKKHSKIPDYHIQFERICTTEEIVNAIISHTDKYKNRKKLIFLRTKCYNKGGKANGKLRSVRG